MTGLWGFAATAAFFFLLMRYLTRCRAATAAAEQTDSNHAASAEDRRIRNIRARAAKEPFESLFLQPEPSGPGSSGGGGGSRRAPQGEPRKIEESVTAVLRKQIPPRDEAPRSWLGGLPMLPAGVEWPRGVNPEKQNDGEVPLHFVAQISCADLPGDLWGGLGPREGWLLLFVNGNTCHSDDPGAWRVLHIAELGEERQLPSDIGPIHDGVYTGSDPYTLSASVFPRWAVDIVRLPNTLRIEGQRAYAAPENLAEILYDGAVVAAEDARGPEADPFTWRCVVAAIDCTVASMTAPSSENAERYRSKMHEALERPGAFEDIVPALERHEAKFWAGTGAVLHEPEPADLDENERERRARMRRHAADRADCVAAIGDLLTAHPTPEALLSRLAAEDEAGWREITVERLGQLREIAMDEGLDTQLTVEHRDAFERAVVETDRTIWALAWGHSDEGKLPVTVERRTLSAMTSLKRAWVAESIEVAATYYLDPLRRALIPAKVLAAIEPHWRSLRYNRPHRMGGYHDGLQSDAVAGPTDRLLLMQFAVDDALHWIWGDCGAVYCFINPDDLEAKAWDRAEFHLECH